MISRTFAHARCAFDEQDAKLKNLLKGDELKARQEKQRAFEEFLRIKAEDYKMARQVSDSPDGPVSCANFGTSDWRAGPKNLANLAPASPSPAILWRTF